MTEPTTSRSTKLILALSILVTVLALLCIALFANVARQPDITTTSGEVVNVSDRAIVIDTPDGRINGLLATEEDQIRIGDLVQVTVIEEPNVLVVEVRD